MKRQKFIKRIRNFVKDQGGMEALQAVSLVAISAIVMIAVATGGNAASEWMKDTWNDLTGRPKPVEVSNNSGGGAGGGGGLGGLADKAGDLLGL